MEDELKTNTQPMSELDVQLRTKELDESISKYRKMVTALQESEGKFRALFEHSLEWVYILDFNGNFIDANKALLNGTGYDQDDIPHVNLASLLEPDQIQKAFLAIDEVKQTGTGKSMYEFRVKRKDGQYVDVEVSGTIIYRDDQPYAILGIVRNATENKRTIEQLRKSMGAIIRTLVVAVETRDPYTAGHQRRVADLARSIATELKLSKDQIEGIRIASMIHDIGKISIPSEILNNPKRLTKYECAMVKNHPEAGCEIIKEIEFPWPITRIIMEHHERMDGSGYPRGLKGEDIMLEARILAVADVVEAMASHRPYRKTPGIYAALTEILNNKHMLYDPAVVDACVKLFNEKNYKFEE